jgi:hypothetical protein
MVNSDFVNLIEKLLDLRWCMPTQGKGLDPTGSGTTARYGYILCTVYLTLTTNNGEPNTTTGVSHRKCSWSRFRIIRQSTSH